MFETIIFGVTMKNAPLQCYKVGVMGCIEISENLYGKDKNGLMMADYTVKFKNKESIKIDNAMSVF